MHPFSLKSEQKKEVTGGSSTITQTGYAEIGDIFVPTANLKETGGPIYDTCAIPEDGYLPTKDMFEIGDFPFNKVSNV